MPWLSSNILLLFLLEVAVSFGFCRQLQFDLHVTCVYEYELAIHMARGSKSTESNGMQMWAKVKVTPVFQDHINDDVVYLLKLEVLEPRLRRVNNKQVIHTYPVNEEFESRLSRPFYFRQHLHGKVIDVFFPEDDPPDVVALKKGVASAFQVTLRKADDVTKYREDEHDDSGVYRTRYAVLYSNDTHALLHRQWNSHDYHEFADGSPINGVRKVKSEHNSFVHIEENRIRKVHRTSKSFLQGKSHPRVENFKKFREEEQDIEMSTSGYSNLNLKECNNEDIGHRSRRSISQDEHKTVRTTLKKDRLVFSDHNKIKWADVGGEKTITRPLYEILRCFHDSSVKKSDVAVCVKQLHHLVRNDEGSFREIRRLTWEREHHNETTWSVLLGAVAAHGSYDAQFHLAHLLKSDYPRKLTFEEFKAILLSIFSLPDGPVYQPLIETLIHFAMDNSQAKPNGARDMALLILAALAERIERAGYNTSLSDTVVKVIHNSFSNKSKLHHPESTEHEIYLTVHLWAFGNLGHSSGLSVLLKHIDHDHSGIRSSAISSLRKFPPIQVDKHLFKVLYQDDDNDVKAAVIDVFIERHQPLNDATVRAVTHALWYAKEGDALDASIKEFIENHGKNPKAIRLWKKRKNLKRKKRALVPFLHPREFRLGNRRQWGKSVGGRWLGAEAFMRFINEMRMRIGIFGGAFNIDIDNAAVVGAHILNFRYNILNGKIAFKAAASFKNDIPKDLIHLVADLSDSILGKMDNFLNVVIEKLNWVRSKLNKYLPFESGPFTGFVDKLVKFVNNFAASLRPVSFIEQFLEQAKSAVQIPWLSITSKINAIGTKITGFGFLDKAVDKTLIVLNRISEIIRQISINFIPQLPLGFNLKDLLQHIGRVSLDAQLNEIKKYLKSLGFLVPTNIPFQWPFGFGNQFILRLPSALQKVENIGKHIIQFGRRFLDISIGFDAFSNLRLPKFRLPKLAIGSTLPSCEGDLFCFGMNSDWRILFNVDLTADFPRFLTGIEKTRRVFAEFESPTFNLDTFFRDITSGGKRDLKTAFPKIFSSSNKKQPHVLLGELVQNLLDLFNNNTAHVQSYTDLSLFFNLLGNSMRDFTKNGLSEVCSLYKYATGTERFLNSFSNDLFSGGSPALKDVELTIRNSMNELENFTRIVDNMVSQLKVQLANMAKQFVSTSLTDLKTKLRGVDDVVRMIKDFANGTASKATGLCKTSRRFSAKIIDTVQAKAREAIGQLTSFAGQVASQVKSISSGMYATIGKVEKWYQDNLSAGSGKLSRAVQFISDIISVVGKDNGLAGFIKEAVRMAKNVLLQLRRLPEYARKARKMSTDVSDFADKATTYRNILLGLDLRNFSSADFDKRLRGVCDDFEKIVTASQKGFGSLDVAEQLNIFFNAETEKIIAKGIQRLDLIKQPIDDIRERIRSISSGTGHLFSIFIDIKSFSRKLIPLLKTIKMLPNCQEIKSTMIQSLKPCVKRAAVIGTKLMSEYNSTKTELYVILQMIPEVWKYLNIQSCIKGSACMSKDFIKQVKDVKEKITIIQEKVKSINSYRPVIHSCRNSVKNISTIVRKLEVLVQQVYNFSVQEEFSRMKTLLTKITGSGTSESKLRVKRSLNQDVIQSVPYFLQNVNLIRGKYERFLEQTIAAMKEFSDNGINDYAKAINNTRNKTISVYNVWRSANESMSRLIQFAAVGKEAEKYSKCLRGLEKTLLTPIVGLMVQSADFQNIVQPHLSKYVGIVSATENKVNGVLNKVSGLLEKLQTRQRELDPRDYLPWNQIPYCSKDVCVRSIRRLSSLYLNTIFLWKFPHFDDLSSMSGTGKWIIPGLFDNYKPEGIARLSQSRMILGMHGVSGNKDKAALLVVVNDGGVVKKILQLHHGGRPLVIAIGGIAVAKDNLWISDSTSRNIYSVKRTEVTTSFSIPTPTVINTQAVVISSGIATSISYDIEGNSLYITDSSGGFSYGYKLLTDGSLLENQPSPFRTIRIGKEAQGMCIVRQSGKEYACVSRCAAVPGYQCRLEFHDLRGDNAIRENSPSRVVRTPSGLESVQTLSNELIAVVFSSAVISEKENIRNIGGDYEDRYFIIKMPIFETHFVIHENCRKLKVRQEWILRPDRLIPVGKMKCGSRRKRSAEEVLLESDVYSEDLGKLHTSKHRVRRSTSDINTCLLNIRSVALEGFQQFFHVETYIVVFGIPVRLFAGLSGHYSISYHAGLCLPQKTANAGIIPGAWVSAYAGAALSVLLVEAGITIEARILETHLIPDLSVHFSQWPLQVCLELKMRMTPLSIRVSLWYRLRLCSEVRVWVIGCSFKWKWCPKKIIWQWTWSANSIERTLFSNCKKDTDKTPPTAGSCQAKQIADQAYFVQWHGFREDKKINHYIVAIGSIEASNDDYAAVVGTSTSTIVKNVAIMHGRDVFASVYALNDELLKSRPALCPVFHASRKAPAITFVHDGSTDEDVDYQADTNSIGAQYAFKSSSEDVVSVSFGISSKQSCTLDTNELDITGLIPLGESLSGQVSGLRLTPGHKYYTRIVATNSVGLQSVKCSDGVTIDITPPKPSFLWDGGKNNDSEFLPSFRQVRAKYEFRDEESPLVAYRIKLVILNGSGLTPWINVPVFQKTPMISGLSLRPGESYKFILEGTNAVGMSAVISSNGFGCDDSPPNCDDKVKDVQNENDNADIDYVRALDGIHGKWKCSDAESGIHSQVIAVGTYPGGKNISPFVDIGALYSFLMNDGNTFVRFSNFTIYEKKRYYITVKVTNKAGLSRTLTSDGIMIDTTPPKVTKEFIKDGLQGRDKNYTSETSSFSAHWQQAFIDAESGIIGYYIGLGSSPGQTDVKGLVAVGKRINATITTVFLEHGHLYYTTVVGCNSVNMCVNESSDGFLVDAVPPHAGEVISGFKGPPVYYQYNSKFVWGRWNWCLADDERQTIILQKGKCSNSSFYDVHSGIREFGITVKSLENDQFLLPARKAGRVRYFGRSIDMKNGIYFVSVEAKDRSGMKSYGYSNPLVVDSTPPFVVKVQHGYEGKALEYTNKRLLQFKAYIELEEDMSPLKAFKVGVGSFVGADDFLKFETIVPETTTLFLRVNWTSQPCRVENGRKYFITVWPINMAGNFMINSSRPLIADFEPPKGAVVLDGWNLIDAEYQIYTSFYRAHWYGLSDFSGIETMYICLTSQANNPTCDVNQPEEVINKEYHIVTGLNLTSGRTYFGCLKITDKAGNTAYFWSNGVFIDSTPPLSGLVWDGSAINDIEFQKHRSSLQASWNKFTEEETSIDHYKVGFGTAPGKYDLQDLVSVGLVTSSISSKLKVARLSNGQRYYATVIGYNILGLSSSAVSSNGVVVDITPPTFTQSVLDVVGLINDVNFSSSASLAAAWKCTDTESPLIKVEIAFGEEPGHGSIMKFTSIPVNQTLYIIYAGLMQGHRYFATVRCVNIVGLWSVSTSSGVIFDNSSAVGAYIEDGEYQSSQSTLKLKWKFTDPESGILGYKLCLYENVSTDYINKCINNPLLYSANQTSITMHLKNQFLESGKRYVVNVTSTNGVGLQSYLLSNGFKVDRTPPLCSNVSISDEDNKTVQYISGNSPIRIYWKCDDRESPLARFRFSLIDKTRSKTVIPFHSAKLSMSKSGRYVISGSGKWLPKYKNRNKYVVGLEVSNSANLTSLYWTNSVTVDSTPPLINKVKMSYEPSTKSLICSWLAFDEESSVKLTLWALLTSSHPKNTRHYTEIPAKTRTLNISNVPLANGKVYFLSVTVENNAGVVAKTTSNGVIIDNTPPKQGGIESKYVFPPSYDRSKDHVVGCSITVAWSGFLDFESGIKSFSWAFGTEIGRLKHQLSFRYTEIPKQDSVGGVVIRNITLIRNSTYYVCIRAINGAGLQRTDCSKGMRVILGAFLPGIVSDGPAALQNDIDFQLDDHAIWVHWKGFKDHVYGVSLYRWCIGNQSLTNESFCIYPFAVEPYTKTKSHRFHNLTLSHGRKYFIIVEARNNRNETATASSDGVTVDRTAPVGKSIQILSSVGKETIYITSSSLPVVSWSFIEQESAIDYFKLHIGRVPFGDDVASYKHISGINSSCDLDDLNITLSQGQIFYVTVTAFNVLGLQTDLISRQVVIDWTPPVAGKVFDGNMTTSGTLKDIDFQSNKKLLSAHWNAFSDTESDIREYHWCIGTAEETCNVWNLTSSGLNTYFKQLLKLQEDVRYYVTVQATNGAGLTTTSISDGVTIDTSLPNILGVVLRPSPENDNMHNSLQLQRSNRDISFFWDNIFDSESGITSIVWCSGTRSGICDIIPRTEVKTAIEPVFHRVASPIDSGIQLYVTLEATNGAGLTSTNYSTGLVIDSTSPIKGTVIVETFLFGRYLRETEPLQAKWEGFHDNESGIKHYEWRICKYASRDKCITTFVNTRQRTVISNVILELESGVAYVMVVRAYNKVGLVTEALSSSFIRDVTGPVPGNVYDGRQKGIDINWQNSKEVISATWTPFRDKESRIYSYEMCAGSSLGECDIVDFKNVSSQHYGHLYGLDLTNAKAYYVTVRATNGAGYQALSSSDGVRIDSTPPIAKRAHDGNSKQITYQSVGPFITAKWDDYLDPESGIEHYMLCAGTARGACDVIKKREVKGNSASFQLTLPVSPGIIIYPTLIVVNGVGAVTKVHFSGVTVDGSPPVIGEVRDLSGNGTNIDVDYITSKEQLCVSWQATDVESAIISTKISVCRTINPDDCPVSSSESGNQNPFCLLNLELKEAVRYTVVVQATNGAMLTSTAASNGFRLDSTPPDIGDIIHVENPGVGIDGNTYHFTRDKISVRFKGIEDRESGIDKHLLCVGSRSRVCDKMNLTDIGNASVFSTSNISLAHGEMSFVSIVTFNKAGLKSKITSSDGVYTDKTGPVGGNVADGLNSGQDIDAQQNNDVIMAHWTTFYDPESDVIKVSWCAGLIPESCDIIGDAFVKKETNVVYKVLKQPMANGQRYHVTVKAINGAGILTSHVSDGVTVDTTPPIPGFVFDGNLTDIDFLFGDADVKASWSNFSDPESSIEHYEVAVCEMLNNTNCPQQYVSVNDATEISVTGLDLINGVAYYVKVKAFNKAMKPALSVSDGFTVDFTPPVPGKLLFGSETNDTLYHGDSGRLDVMWTKFHDVESGIVSYEVCLGSIPEKCSASSLMYAGLSTNLTMTSLKLNHGERYFATVIGTNGAGLKSKASSEGIWVDLTAPVLQETAENSSTSVISSTVNNTKTETKDSSNNQVRLSCSKEFLELDWDELYDLESHLARYEWCVGTRKRICDVVQWRVSKDKTNAKVMTQRLPEGETLYGTVIGINRAGLRKELFSLPCMIGTRYPVVVQVTDIREPGASNGSDIYWTRETKSLSVLWYSSNKSNQKLNITRLQLGILDLSSNTSIPRLLKNSWSGFPLVHDLLNIPAQYTNVTIRGVSLQPFRTYSLAVRAWSSGGTFTEAATDGVRIEPQAQPVRRLTIRDKSGEEERKKWLPGLILPSVNKSALDPDILYVSSPENVVVVASDPFLNTSSSEEENNTSVTDNFEVLVTRITSDQNNTNSTSITKSMVTLPGFARKEGPCCARFPSNATDTLVDFHVRPITPVTDFGFSVSLLTNGYVAVGAKGKAFVFSLYNKTKKTLKLDYSTYNNESRVNVLWSKNILVLSAGSLVDIFRYNRNDDDSMSLMKMVQLNRCFSNSNDLSECTYSNSMEDNVAASAHTVAVNGKQSNESVVGIYNQVDNEWKIDTILRPNTTNPYFGHSLSLDDRYLAVSAGLNVLLYEKNDSFWRITLNVSLDQFHMKGIVTVRLHSKSLLGITSKTSGMFAMLKLDVQNKTYKTLCSYSFGDDTSLSGSMDIAKNVNNTLVAFGIGSDLSRKDGVQLLEIPDESEKTENQICINLGRTFARESGTHTNGEIPRASVSFKDDTIIFGNPSVSSWSGETEMRGRIYDAVFCSRNHVRVPSPRIISPQSMTCKPCKEGEKSFGGFSPVCLPCNRRVCKSPEMGDSRYLETKICANKTCLTGNAKKDKNQINSSEEEMFYRAGPENTYTVNLRETTRAGLTTISISEAFILDTTPPQAGVVYDGLAGDYNQNCSANTTLGEHHQCSTRSFSETDIDYTNETTAVHARWFDFRDNESNIVEYFWCVGSRPYSDNMKLCESTGLRLNGSHYDLSLHHRDKYYVTVLACNGAEICTAVSSNGVIIDKTLPSVDYVRDGVMGPDMDFQVFTDIIFAYFRGIDQESGISSHEVAWGTSGGQTDIKDFEEVGDSKIWFVKTASGALKKGKRYYATVRVTNGAGLLSDPLSSNGIVVGKSEYTFDNKTSGSFFFDTVDVTTDGKRKDKGVGKTFGTLSVPEGAVKERVKLRSFSLDKNDLKKKKTDEGPIEDPKASKPKQFMLGNYSFQIKAIDPSENGKVIERYRFAKPVLISMFYDVDNLIKANKKTVSKDVTKDEINPVLLLWNTKNKTWFDASLTCPVPWSHVDRSVKLLSLHLCHLTQFAFFWSFKAGNGVIEFNKNETVFNGTDIINVKPEMEGSQLSLSVLRRKGSNGRINVYWVATNNGSVELKTVIRPTSGILTMNESQWNATLTITLVQIKRRTSKLEISLKLQNTSGGALLGTPERTKVTIVVPRTATIVVPDSNNSFMIGILTGVFTAIGLVLLTLLIAYREKRRRSKRKTASTPSNDEAITRALPIDAWNEKNCYELKEIEIEKTTTTNESNDSNNDKQHQTGTTNAGSR